MIRKVLIEVMVEFEDVTGEEYTPKGTWDNFDAVIEDLEYDFTSNVKGVTVVDTEIRDITLCW